MAMSRYELEGGSTLKRRFDESEVISPASFLLGGRFFFQRLPFIEGQSLQARDKNERLRMRQRNYSDHCGARQAGGFRNKYQPPET